MPVELNITESVTALDTTVVEITLTSSSTPGPAGPGVPTGGTDGQVLTKASGTDYDTAWEDAAGGPGGGAPADVDYLVGTASGDLSAEIVVGATPGGELGGTWASPTVDATHSGSSHAAVQAAAEATAAAALSAHLTDTSDAHDASAISSVAAGNLSSTDVQAALNELDTEKAAASHVHAGEDITSGTVADARIASTIARDSEVTAAVSAHESDTTNVHGIADTSALALTANAVMDGDTAGGVLGGTYPNPSFAADMATQAELDAHLNDTTDAHDASAISIADAGNDFTATDVEGALAELQSDHEADATALSDHIADTSDAHDASAISVLDTGTFYTATDVEAVLAEIAPQLGGGGGLFDAYALLRDEKAANTQGGTFTQGAWRTRDLTTESFDPDGIVSLSSNQFTLQAGTYYIYARAPALRVAFHKCKIANITDTSDALIGSNAFTITGADAHMTDAVVQGRITIAAQKTFELQHWCTSTKATDGFGSLNNIDSKVEVYAEVQIWREA